MMTNFKESANFIWSIADQSSFLLAVQNVFMQRRKIDLADLYEEPFINFGVNAAEKLFSNVEIAEMIKLTKMLVA